MRLLDLIHQRRGQAEAFTKPFQSQVEEDCKNYELSDKSLLDEINVDLTEGFQRRYYFPIPLIFTNHEAFLASMFDRPPDLLFKSRGKDDDEKKLKIEAAYEYLVDKLDLESFMNDSAWWYALSGFVSAHVGYEQKTEETPAIDENTGEPMISEETGEPMMITNYVEDDPFVVVGDPKKDSFSPESKYSIGAEFVPYYLTEELMEPDEIKRIYGKDVEPDATLDVAETVKTSGDESKKDTDRVKVWRYYGTLPKMVSGEVKDWEPGKNYGIIVTQKKILFKDATPLNDKQCRILKLHGVPNKFFGFGLAKLLKPMQKEKSIRRGQQVRYADVAAFPKLLHDSTATFDKKTMRDPRENLTVLYSEKEPKWLAAPNIGDAVGNANQLADQDAQQASGLIDISTGAQNSSTVDTATGQTIFADAAEKRIRKAKKNFVKFYREIVILLLKMCQLNWSSEKLLSITDDHGNSSQISVSKEDFKDIDFDKDIDIDAESVSINKDVLRQQAIAMYDKTKDDPIVNRREVFSFMLQQGFMVQNPDRFIKESDIPPGTVLVNPQTGEQYTLDESGELVSAQMQAEMAQPGQGGQVGSDPAAQMAGAQNVQSF